MLRGIGLKIFLSFWLIFAVLIASFAILPDRGYNMRLIDHVREDGLVASALFEQSGAQACAGFADALATRARMQLALFDDRNAVVCHSVTADLALLQQGITSGGAADGHGSDGRRVVTVSVQAPSGARFTAAGASLADYNVTLPRPPFPYGTVALAILVSGFVCFSLARYFARPLQQVRDASYRLAAGDLRARVGPQVASRKDEIGDLVRDFDAMASRIEALVHAQGQLMSDISHELRSPLARLNVALELARRKAGPEAQVDLTRIETEVNRMNDLIGRVLALARAESAETSKTGDAVDVAEVVRRVTDDADYEAQRQQKTVALRVASAATVQGDPQLIASAVDNIVRNAVRYTARQSSVEVVVSGTDREAVVTVRDHGPGVPGPELERIFAPFHRLESARNRETGGVGLGLAIARRAIAVHGGNITAENAADGGLRVTVRIPVKSGDRATV